MIEEIENKINDDLENSSKLRFANLHISEMAICGYKYRYSYDNKLIIPHRWLFEIGNAFEYILFRYIKKVYKNAQSQYEVIYEDNDYKIIGHLDVYINEIKTVIEIKTSKSNNYTDIYERQLFAYMVYGAIENGILLKYNILNDKLFETKYHINDIHDSTIESFGKNITAFKENRYIEGIENSLCGFCENINCKMSGKRSVK